MGLRSRPWNPIDLVARSDGIALAGVIVLSAVVGAAIGRGLGLLTVALAVGGLLVLLTGIRLASILGLAFLVAAVPASAFSKGSPDVLLIAGELSLAVGVLLLGAQRELTSARVWWALAFGVLYWLAAERSLAAGGAPLNPRLGFLAASAQVLLVASGGSRESGDDEVVEFSRIACLIGGALGLWAILEFVLNRGFAFPLVAGVRRAIGPFGNPNYFGGVLAQVAVLSLALATLSRRRGLPWVRVLLLFALAGTGLLATLSRGAFIAAAAGCLMVWTCTLRGRSRSIAWVGIALASLAVLPLLLRAVDSRRIEVTPGTPLEVQEQLSDSVRARYLAFRLGVDYGMAHPLTGVGLERFPVLAERDPTLGIHMNTHDEVVRVLAEAGLPALAALAAVLWLVVRRVRGRSTDVVVLVLPVALTYLVCNVFLNGLEFVAFSYPTAALLFLGSGRPHPGEPTR